MFLYVNIEFFWDVNCVMCIKKIFRKDFNCYLLIIIYILKELYKDICCVWEINIEWIFMIELIDMYFIVVNKYDI